MIFQIFNVDEDLLRYIPTSANLKTIPRDFLLSVLANIKRENYTQLYSKCKEIKAERSTGENRIYKAQIINQFLMVYKILHR